MQRSQVQSTEAPAPKRGLENRNAPDPGMGYRMAHRGISAPSAAMIGAVCTPGALGVRYGSRRQHGMDLLNTGHGQFSGAAAPQDRVAAAEVTEATEQAYTPAPNDPDIAAPPVHDPDAGLIERLAQGDQRAAGEMVDRYLTRIVNHAFRMLNNRDDAEEVAQDVFIRIWNNVADWQPGRAKFSTWVYRITQNLCLDRLRKHREVTMAEPPEILDERPIASDVIAADQVSRTVQDAMERLPDRQKAALSLCYFENLSNSEAADILDVSVEALESLLARGRRGLKTMLKHDADYLLDG